MGRVLAVGIDGAEATVVERMAADGELPTLRDIGAAGRWQEVRGPGDFGVGGVWPTFVRGVSVQEHEVHSDMLWDPDQMRLTRWSPSEPFWGRVADRVSVGALDVPTAAPTGRLEAFEVCEWGAHVKLFDEMTVSPDPARSIVAAHGTHPFATHRKLLPGPQDEDGIVSMASGCAAGVRQRARLAQALIAERRPDFAVIVFPEVHEAGHGYWHTFERDHPMYADVPPYELPPDAGIDGLLREVDSAIAGLAEAMGPDTAIAVFSLHGMGPGRGRPTFLPSVLADRGWSAPERSPRRVAALARAALGTMRRRAPERIRYAYHSLISQQAMWKIATVTQSPSRDWSRTRAFALSSDDQHGFVRINLRGRERDGIVAPADYEPMRDELAAELAELEDDQGRRLIARVLKGREGPAKVLPDLVVHWADAALARSVRVAGTSVEADPIMLEFTGNHAGRLSGFCVSSGLPAESERLQVEELSDMLANAATA